MAYNYEYPYVDASQLNEDWLLSKMKEVLESDEEQNKAIEAVKEQLDTESKKLEKEIADFKVQIKQENAQLQQEFTQKFTQLQSDLNSRFEEQSEEYNRKFNEEMQKITDEFTEQNQHIADMQAQLDAAKEQLDATQQLLEDVKNGEYVDLYLESIEGWLRKNMKQIVSETVKYIFFGLTDDGYFVAYIPDSWDAIGFNTVTENYSEFYGRLVLNW